MIDPAAKRFLILASICIGAVALGWQLATGNFVLLLLLLSISSLALLQRGHQLQPEALLISFLFFGYILGNRGFAQLNVMGIFVGELCMIFLFTLGLLYLGTKRTLPYSIDSLGFLILVYIGIGTIRLSLDIGQYGITAVRDYAACYYAVFYFLVQSIQPRGPSQELIWKVFAVAFALLIPCYLFFNNFPEFFLNNLLIRQVPLIYFKDDLAGAFLGCGFFLFFFQFQRKNTLLALALAMGSFLSLLYTTSRAALVGFLIALVFFYLSGAKKIVRFLLISLAITGIPFIYFSIASNQNLVQSKAFAVYEHLISIVDVTGSYEYRNREAMNSGDNNRYRIEWWNNVTRETLHLNPLFGLGFGYDLTQSFLDDYYGNTEMDFSVRSPHSILMTLFGRMGFVGLSIFLLITFKILQLTIAEIARCRQQGQLSQSITCYAMIWVILMTAVFGVVLEGPMGAIIFWSLLGLNRNQTQGEEDQFPSDT